VAPQGQRPAALTYFPEATDVLITADGGGSNGYRVRLWRLMLQNLADRTGLTFTVAHLPPGTSKWNKIEGTDSPANLRQGSGQRQSRTGYRVQKYASFLEHSP